MFLLLTTLAYLTWFERKVVAHMQSRWGPYRAGPHGLLQPLADGLKFLFKEDPRPAGVERLRYFLAALLLVFLARTSKFRGPLSAGKDQDFLGRPPTADFAPQTAMMVFFSEL